MVGSSSKDRRRPTAARARAGAQRGAARAGRRNERRATILAAALDEFAARGFEATRLDDVARRAGVAKGTIYLYFRDKESLFQELVRTMLSPLVGAIEAAPLRDLPIRAVVEMIVDVFVQRDLRHAPQGRHPADHHRRAALSQARRVLLSRGDRARAAGHSRPADAGGGARRACPRRARALSAVAGRAGAARDPVERPVRSLRAARRARADARPCRSAVRDEGSAMSARRTRPRDAGGAGRPRRLRRVAGCRHIQGWVEAELIFVGPDETGRIETLTVREGDQVELRALAVHARHRAAGRRRGHAGGGGEERPAGLRSRGDAGEEHVRHAKGAGGCRGRRCAPRRRGSTPRRPADAPQGVQPRRRHRPADLFPRRRTGAGRQADRRAPAAGQPEGALLRQRSDAAASSSSATPSSSIATAAPPISPPRSASSPARRNSRRR